MFVFLLESGGMIVDGEWLFGSSLTWLSRSCVFCKGVSARRLFSGERGSTLIKNAEALLRISKSFIPKAGCLKWTLRARVVWVGERWMPSRSSLDVGEEENEEKDENDDEAEERNLMGLKSLVLT